MAVKITGADRGTPAEQAGLAGATLLSIDGNEINDMLDYEFFSSGPKLELALAVSYTHLRAHETGRNLVCRLLLEKKKKKNQIKKKKTSDKTSTDRKKHNKLS